MRGQIRKRISYRFASFRIHRPEQNMKMRSKPEPEPGPGPKPKGAGPSITRIKKQTRKLEPATMTTKTTMTPIAAIIAVVTPAISQLVPPGPEAEPLWPKRTTTLTTVMTRRPPQPRYGLGELAPFQDPGRLLHRLAMNPPHPRQKTLPTTGRYSLRAGA